MKPAGPVVVLVIRPTYSPPRNALPGSTLVPSFRAAPPLPTLGLFSHILKQPATRILFSFLLQPRRRYLRLLTRPRPSSSDSPRLYRLVSPCSHDDDNPRRPIYEYTPAAKEAVRTSPHRFITTTQHARRRRTRSKRSNSLPAPDPATKSTTKPRTTQAFACCPFSTTTRTRGPTANHLILGSSLETRPDGPLALFRSELDQHPT